MLDKKMLYTLVRCSSKGFLFTFGHLYANNLLSPEPNV